MGSYQKGDISKLTMVFIIVFLANRQRFWPLRIY